MPNKTDQLLVRLPEGMREKLKVRARFNNRSLNAEVVSNLIFYETDPFGDRRIYEAVERIIVEAHNQRRWRQDVPLRLLGAIRRLSWYYFGNKIPKSITRDQGDLAGFDLVTHLERQREFSLKTFGPGARTQGVLDHIRKELAEIEAEPADIAEWVDVIILAFDGAWRAGWEPAAIVEAIVAKQTKNEARQWPDWRTADPDKAIEHVRAPSLSNVGNCGGFNG